MELTLRDSPRTQALVGVEKKEDFFDGSDLPEGESREKERRRRVCGGGKK